MGDPVLAQGAVAGERLEVVRNAADTLRQHVVNMAADSGAHVGGSMSVVDILAPID